MSFNLNNITRENVKRLKPYSSARDEYVSDGSEMIFLDANENPFDNGVNRYPDPQQRSLKAVLADQKGIESDNILLGNGSDEVLDLLFRAFCEPKEDNIISLPPTYGMYKVLSGINTIENREVLLTENFQPDVNAILNTIDNNSKLLFICSPNNPTGNSFSKENITKLLHGFNGLVVIDEAYIDFAKNESWVSQLSDFPNLVVTQTLSKAYGMAGIRLGICKVLEGVSFIDTIYPTDANFILVKVDDAYKRYSELLERGIVIRNRSTQPLCENTLRFTVGIPEENIKLIEVLKSLS